MLDVMRDVKMWSEQVKARDGRTYRLRITPYRTLENKIDGVVLTLLDINDLVGSDRPKTAAVSFPSAVGAARRFRSLFRPSSVSNASPANVRAV
jgi:two-component system, chemotaxis family, CheB/CheR fusion protein